MQDLTVLVLEDEPFQRLVTVTALEKVLQGPILQAAGGEEAIAVLAACDAVDIVLCDLKMAGMDGLAFLRHASSSGKVGAVVLCSELDPVLRQGTVAMIHCLGLTFLGDLGKPFNLDGFSLLVKRYREYCSSIPRLSPAELPTLGDVQRGLDNGEFEAYYQPKVTLEGQLLVGAEVLARWTHPQWGVLLPAHFLPVMEEHNLVDRMFWQLFDQGLALQLADRHLVPLCKGVVDVGQQDDGVAGVFACHQFGPLVQAGQHRHVGGVVLQLVQHLP